MSVQPGEFVSCARCGTRLLRVLAPLRAGDVLAANKFESVHPEIQCRFGAAIVCPSCGSTAINVGNHRVAS